MFIIYDSVAPKAPMAHDTPMASATPPQQTSATPVTPRRTPARKSATPGGSSAATPNGTRSQPTTPRGKTAGKSASQTMRMLRGELPEDAKGIKVRCAY